MSEIKAMTVEELSVEELKEFAVDILHRINVHETMWFLETEHQLGMDKAMNAMDYAWAKTKDIAKKRLDEFMPLDVYSINREELLKYIDSLSKNWLAQDGVWFQAVEFTEGMNDAKRTNDSCWARFSPFEAHSIKTFLGMEEQPGLKGLEQALNFRIYGRLNVQSSVTEDGALIFSMNECRVQTARIRKGLLDYPCKSAGLVEYSRFASAIDKRIKTECICCPPDSHPDTCFCSWKFTI